MPVEQLKPSCNLLTVKDGRGGIFSWVPPDAIREFNLIHLRAGKVRGLHYHEHFTEYLLFVGGSGVLVERDDPTTDGNLDVVHHVAIGSCFRIPVGVMHTVRAVEDLRFVAMLTKPWGECDPPIVQVETLPHLLGDS